MDKPTVEYLIDGILLRKKKEGAIDTHNNMDKSQN